MKIKICGIYKITSPSNRIYIGQSIDIERRWKITYKGSHSRSQTRLYASFIKYGLDNHLFEVIEECEVDKLNERERYWQEYYNVLDQDKGLNCRYTKTDDKSGKLSESTIQKLSISKKGTKASKDTRKRMSEKRIGEGNSRSRMVINTETGIYYGCVKDAALTIGVTRKTLSNRLNGIQRNLTPFRYVSKYSNKIIPDKSKHIRENSKGANNHQSKLILNLETGIYYDYIEEASNSLGVKRDTLGGWLRGTYRNKSSMTFV